MLKFGKQGLLRLTECGYLGGVVSRLYTSDPSAKFAARKLQANLNEKEYGVVGRLPGSGWHAVP
jgi:hypothetical protein